MVLLAASICTRDGKILLSRQFVEMIKARIEGLWTIFSKLMSPDAKEHTFVETDSVRYVYQPIENLYIVLLTTKTSNILEDLENLRLFALVIPEYSKRMEESDILENAFEIIFAFDEIVALGYRESVNLEQIRKYVEMDSHDEKVSQAIRLTKEGEAKQKMREKAKELKRKKIEIKKRAGNEKDTSNEKSSNFVGSDGFDSSLSDGTTLSTPEEPPKPIVTTKMQKPNKAMKLGGKVKEFEGFVDQLMQEEEHITRMDRSSMDRPSMTETHQDPQYMKMESVQIKIEERLKLTARRDGGLESMELTGMLTLRILDELCSKIKLQLQTPSNPAVQIQPHPNIDKDLLRTRSQIVMKHRDKAFPTDTEIGLLKWRFQTTKDSQIPLSINCWPCENSQGGCDVNIEYELEPNAEHLDLEDVVITIPIPQGVNTPVVAEHDGEYTFDKRNGLQWRLPVIDATNKNGSMEFSCGGNLDDFFPVHVSFFSKKSYSQIQVLDCMDINNEAPVKHSTEVMFYLETYDIV